MKCRDCGDQHTTGLDAMKCDWRVNRIPPGITDRAQLLEAINRAEFEERRQ